MKKVFKKLIGRFILLGVILLFFLSVLENKMVFAGASFREKTKLVLPEELDFEVWKRSLDGNEFVETLFLRTELEPRGNLIFAHGNGELIDDWPEMLSFYYKNLGFNVLIVEYRGYGRSGGSPYTETIVEDFLFFYEKLRDRTSDLEKLVLHGRSLGGGIVSKLIERIPATNLILESTFTRLSDLAFEKFFIPKILLKNTMDTIDTLSKNKTPTLVIHGSKDQMIPIHHGRALLEAAIGEKESYFREFGHNDGAPDRKEYWEAISSFLSR